MNGLKIASAKLEEAENKMLAALRHAYPEGSDIEFFIMHGQVNPSTGTVIAHDPRRRTIRVRHHQAKPRSRYGVRDVHYKDVL